MGTSQKYDSQQKLEIKQRQAQQYNNLVRQMSGSIIKTLIGYSRFALQQQRRNDMRTGVFVAKNLSVLPSQSFSYIKQPISIPPINFDAIQVPQNNKVQIPNLTLELNQQKNKIKVIGRMLDERTQNQIMTIQYEANSQIQDRLVASTLQSIDAEIISVFDGHGGDKLSDYCASNFVENLENFIQKNKKSLTYQNNIEQLIVDSLKFVYQTMDNQFYQNVYKSLIATNNKKIKNVGSCALTVIIFDGKIYVANCGDSEAIVVSKGKNGEIKYRQLNQRLSVNNPAQRERLKKQFPNDVDIIVQQQSGCFYLKGRLQPTRALGDYHLKFQNLFQGKGKFNGPYIKSEPDIKIFPLLPQYESIVVASDGVWDFVQKNIVAQASLNKNPHQIILQKTLDKIAKIHKKSVNQIKQVSASQKRTFHDDISIAVVSLGKKTKIGKLI